MPTSKFEILSPPPILADDVECFSLVKHTGAEGFSIRVAPKAVPGIVFHHNNGHTAIESIVTNSASIHSISTLFLCGAGIEPSTMNFAKGSYTTIQVILKPHALSTLFGINASTLTNSSVELNEFSPHDLNEQMLNASDEQRIVLLTEFLVTHLKKERTRDKLIEESLRLIHQDTACNSVKYLLEYLSISERQFERRFNQAVGISPQSYIRVTRFNEAIRLIKTGQYEKLTDIAYALNYYDQSHLIRDINSFSGITPKNVAQKEDDFYHTQVGYSYV
jgi:AraC-like DNA-binding protein